MKLKYDSDMDEVSFRRFRKWFLVSGSIVISMLVVLLYFTPIGVIEKRTSGDVTFTDSAGNPLSGAIELSGAGMSSGLKPDVNFISWTNIPNARVYFNAFDTKNVSINLMIAGNSPKSTVMLENHGSDLPGGVNLSAPGMPIKYMEISTTGISFEEVEISILYTRPELQGLDEENLAIYRYDNATQSWSELSTTIDANNNIASTTVNSLSIFALSTQIPQKIEVRDTRNVPVSGDFRIYDEAKNLKKQAKTNTLSVEDVPAGGELEVDALESKNVAIKMKVKAINRGEFVLDDFGKRNPVSVPLPGRTVKFVETGVSNISFSYANITIRYTDAELNGGNENGLTIYHWNGASWDALPTTIDFVNKTLSATTTSLSPSGVATNVTYYLENNATTQSIGADGTTNYTASGGQLTVVPYKNLLKNGTMATQANLIYATTVTTEIEVYRFYLRLNYTDNTNISANATGQIRWQGVQNTDSVNVSLVDYNPSNGTKITMGNQSFTVSSTAANYQFTISNKNYTVPKGDRLMLRINTTTTPGTGSVFLYFNDYTSYINVTETNLTGVGGGGATYNISGYVTNQSSGLSLNGATVQTNTSLTTTSNATGFYNFTGISNGTYIINATLTGYAVNSINVTISGADNNTANISLSPVPTYLLSGYVTNASNSAAISGATVATNTSQTTTTNITGYYNFTLSNGTYLITASMAGYSDNSTTGTVNGAAASNVNIILTPTPPVSGKILVATNRFVILDDPNDIGAQNVSGSGFMKPEPNDWGNRSTLWTGKNTTINATALYIDNSGTPVSGKIINFTLYWPNGTALTIVNDTTNSLGLANFSYDLNNTNFYGRWTIRAENSSTGANTSFIYNWWGCSWGTSGRCGSRHSTADPANQGYTSANSPYLFGRDKITAETSFHTTNQNGSGDWINSDVNACTHCHQSYDNNSGGAYTAVFRNYTADVHRNVSCANSSCHGGYTIHNTNQLIASCYNISGGCHASRADVSNKSTLNSSTISTALSLYSINSTSFNATFHTPDSTVPCIICHGPVHNISKPDATQQFIKNGNTEDTQCTACHSSYNEHNSSNATSGGVNCTLCHSDDVHVIQVFAQNATYIPLNKNNPNPARGNCTSCHQNATFFGMLKNTTINPMAGNYTGRDPPQVAVPMEHSNDPNAGVKWNQMPGYWNNSLQITWCRYCHGNTTHNSVALGRPAQFDGNNVVNSTISALTSWCASCHWQGYSSGANTYNDMVSIFNVSALPVPPEIAGNASYGANQSNPVYFNHSSVNKDDSSCNNCHAMSTSTTITGFMHDVAGGINGGGNCTSCHNTGGSAGTGKLVNFTAMNDSLAIHKNLNINAATSLPTENKKCWACHGNGSEPDAHPENYKTPYNCTSCHVPVSQNLNYTPNTTLLNVTQHYWNGTNISTSNATSCYACHNRTEMMLGSFDPDGAGSVYGGANGGNNSTSHYGKKRADYSAIQGTNDYCYRCHNNASTVFPFIDTNNRTISNHSMNHNSTNPACSDCHAQGRLHNSTLAKPAFILPNSTLCTSSCHGVGGSAVINNLSRHNNILNCTQCHLNSTRSIHPVRYLQQDGSNWSTTNTTAINCTNCHQTQLANFSSAPIIPNPLKHSSNLSNGSIWGTYWITNNGSCYYCHNNTKHNATALGNIISFLADVNNTRNGSLTTTAWCADCHYNDTVNINYSGTQWNPAPPLITVNNTVNMRWTNHSTYLTSGYKDTNCQTCHALNGSYIATSLNYSHSLDEGIAGGPDCISCHDIGGSRAPADKRIKASSMKLGVHGNLNSNATNSSSIDPINKACWACHGEGTEPTAHPQRYKTPRECSNNDCHSLSQSFEAPMVYSHFKDAELNSNPGNVTSYNVSTGVLCEACHSNSLSAENANLNASVSHYATSEKLIDSINCIYCHLDRDNSIKWGNATEINKNSSSQVEMDRYKNKFTAYAGDFVDLGNGYRMKVTGISAKRDSAGIELYKGDNIVDSALVNTGRYAYEETRIIDNASTRIPVIVLNITGIFVLDNEGFIQFEGFRITRLHSENKTTSCYLCHFRAIPEKHKYTVIDRVDEDVFYTEVLFNSSDKKEYDQQKALLILANKTPHDVRAGIERSNRKTLMVGEKWKLAENYSFTLENVAENSDSASFLLEIGGRSFTYIVKKGEIFDYELGINYLGYTYTNITVFRANVSEISQNLVVLEDIVALSPLVIKIDVNSTVYGYNASWLWKNDTFMTGMIPSDLHAPLLYDGNDGGAACTSCHNVGELGAHKDINKAAASSVSFENKACWACHGDGKEPKWHPSTYKNPRECKSCHMERGLTFNATYIGDEKHGALVNCNQCHVVDTHNIRRFEVVPSIRSLSISKEEAYEGEKVRIYAVAAAGYEMRIRGAEYYIDSLGNPSPMSAVDGYFDEQVEEVTAEVDTSGLRPGNHSVYVRAMERDNKWGTVSSIPIVVKEKESAIVTKRPEKIPDVHVFFILILLILMRQMQNNRFCCKVQLTE